MLVLPSQTRISQPQVPSLIRQDYRNLFESVTLCSLPLSIGFDSKKSITSAYNKSGTATDFLVSSYGIGVKGDGTSGQYTRTISVNAGPMWIVCSFVCMSANASIKYIYGLGGAAGVDNSLITIRAGDGNGGIINAVFRGNNGGNFLQFGSASLVVGRVYHCVLVVPSTNGSQAYMYVNGVKYTSGASTLSFSATFVNERLLADPRTAGSYSPDNVLLTGYGKGQLQESFAKLLSLNPWQIFQPDRRAIFLPATSVTLTYLRPSADISTGSWTPSTGTTLYETLDEVSASDADYIQTSTASSCEIRLAAGATPSNRDNHTIRYRLLAGTGTLTAVLKCGSTTIKSWNHTLTGSAQDISNTLTNAEASTITDYSDLRVTFTGS